MSGPGGAQPSCRTRQALLRELVLTNWPGLILRIFLRPQSGVFRLTTVPRNPEAEWLTRLADGKLAVLLEKVPKISGLCRNRQFVKVLRLSWWRGPSRLRSCTSSPALRWETPQSSNTTRDLRSTRNPLGSAGNHTWNSDLGETTMELKHLVQLPC